MYFLHIFAIILVAQSAFAAYGQWMELKIKNSCAEAIHVTGALEWGKWYANGKRDDETSAPNYNIKPGEEIRVSTCGRADSASGTAGHISIKSVKNNLELVKVSFYCAWSGSSKFKAIVHDEENVAVSHSDYSPDVGALGEMKMRIVCG